MNLFFSFLFPNVNDSVRNEHKKLWDCVAEDLQIADILHTVIDSETEEKALFAEMKYFYPEKEILCLDRTFACASTGLEIRFSGRQSHAAYPENGANPAFAIAETIRSMHEIMSKRHRGIVLGTVIGIEAGSRAYGVSAGEGTLRLTLRAEYQEEYEAFVSNIEQTAKALAQNSGLSVSIARIEEFPATVNDKACVEKVRAAAKALGQTPVCPAEPFRWSEDFGYYLQQTKGAYFGIGCGTAYPALHTMAYEFEDDIIECALRLYHHLLRL